MNIKTNYRNDRLTLLACDTLKKPDEKRTFSQ